LEHLISGWKLLCFELPTDEVRSIVVALLLLEQKINIEVGVLVTRKESIQRLD
jgi:chaperone required for assembly of F1-ATPase